MCGHMGLHILSTDPPSFLCLHHPQDSSAALKRASTRWSSQSLLLFHYTLRTLKLHSSSLSDRPFGHFPHHESLSALFRTRSFHNPSSDSMGRWSFPFIMSPSSYPLHYYNNPPSKGLWCSSWACQSHSIR